MGGRDERQNLHLTGLVDEVIDSGRPWKSEVFRPARQKSAVGNAGRRGNPASADLAALGARQPTRGRQMRFASLGRRATHIELTAKEPPALAPRHGVLGARLQQLPQRRPLIRTRKENEGRFSHTLTPPPKVMRHLESDVLTLS